MPAVNPSEAERASFLALFGRAFIFIYARLGLYVLLTLGALALGAAIYFSARNDVSLQIALATVPPLLTAASYAVCGHDAGLDFEIFPRLIRRFLLVIGIDFIVGTTAGLSLVTFGAGDAVLGALLLAVTASLTYADVFVVFDERGDGLTFVRSFGRSSVVAWHGLETTGRTIFIVAIQLFMLLLTQQAQSYLSGRHVAFASFWAQAALGILLVPAVSVFTALVYLDATGHETKLTCSE